MCILLDCIYITDSCLLTYVGAYSLQGDGYTFSAATLCRFLEDLTKLASFEESRREVPFVILGDEACPLKTYLTKFFARKDVPCEQRVCNYRLSPARRCVAHAFGTLTANVKQRNRNDHQ